MNLRIPLLFVLVMMLLPSLQAQTTSIKWWNPQQSAFPVLEGQAWSKELKNPYDRFPARAEATVPKPVWNLSNQSAGLMLRFRSNSPEIKVRYVVSGQQGMPHMPATGVSGVDLYAVSANGDLRWAAGKYSFGDTITYNFSSLDSVDKYHNKGREYRLFLPLYNKVSWMEIGVLENATFNPLPVRAEKPIVVYGTSIAQGACASRPGMAWTSILGRNLDIPLVNLGFSGSGRLEKEVVDLVAEVDAGVFIIDCLPNLITGSDPARNLTPEQLSERYVYAVKTIRSKHPNAPIVLAEHAGYTDAGVSVKKRKLYDDVNVVLKQTHQKLIAEGFTNLYLIPQANFNQDIEAMVDGIHPSDLGMMYYAKGYEAFLRIILRQPTGSVSTTRPVTQLRELSNYDWEARHQEILQRGRTQDITNVVIGNSITHFWGGLPAGPMARNQESWNTTFGNAKTLNMAYGWDRIENVLWRVYHGELDGFKARQIFVNIGTNNLEWNSDEEIVEGWKLLVDAIKSRQPQAEVVMMGIYPRRNQEKRVVTLNTRLSQIAAAGAVKYIDPGKVFLTKKGTIDEGYFTDGLHPNEKGYTILGKAIKPYVK